MIFLLLLSVGVLMSTTLPQLLPFFIGAVMLSVLFKHA
jgi:hypothetical protein